MNMETNDTSKTSSVQDELFDAARAGDIARLDALKRQGVDLDSRTPRGDTALILASYHAHVDAVAWLIDAGADVNAVNQQGQTALNGVAFKGYLPIAEQLLAAGAAVDPADRHGKTPFLYAASFEHLAMIKLLAAHGADVHRRDANDQNALQLARSNYARRVIPMLEALLSGGKGSVP